MQQLHKMRFLLLIVFLSTLIVVESARAAEGQADMPRSEQTSDRISGQSCRADFQQYCADVPRNRISIAQCIHENESRLSDSCQQALRVVRARFSEFVQSCQADVVENCSQTETDFKPGQGHTLRCLRKHHENLSRPCQQTLDSLNKL